MSINVSRIQVNDLEVHVIKKDIKNIHLGVYPPNGWVRLALPLNTSDENIKLLVISKLPWIKKQQAKFVRQARETRREFVSGESHYFFGNRHLLNVIETKSKSKIELKRKKRIDLYVKPKTSVEKRKYLLENFYRSELKKVIPAFLEKWVNIIGVNVNEVRIKKMKTKWGSCNPKSKRIWLNLELAKKPLHSLEYVLVHELIHLIEKKHNNNFKELMNTFLPKWEFYKSELNESLLSYFSWTFNYD